MAENFRFNLIYSKMRDILESESRSGPRQAGDAIRHSTEVSRDELDEIAKMRKIVLETSAPDPISFTTT